ncbi:substrate-binding domain-containing protein [Cellulomonas xylanilytica]|uniref:ABC transporter substrate-binding protein n=1 Tax=Cellulomonas xylanilytica TaxID=233583 RepID=A0A510V5Y5_9CELL|nr:substrate-binding domain-containing protein [Cellulomonas xylanilytica]GEK22279.1 ABC transporter substrate-binding protein [Cellulomonas xylanilytica]
MRRTLLAALAVLLAVGGCAAAPTSPAPSDQVIALLLPESKTARYEAVDRPQFEKVVDDRCPDCTVIYANANQDAAAQQQQAESALTQGAGVLVLDAVDTAAAVSIVGQAHRRGVPVIAYDRFIEDADLDYYVSFDSRRIGRLQGDALVRELVAARTGPDDPPQGVLLVNGSATDPNSAALEAGVADAFEGAPIEVLAAYDTPDWSPDKAQEWVTGQLTQYSGLVDAVYAANDGTAGGAISAMKAAGLDPVPPVTGQDAELAAIQRIVTGDQSMTVYKAISEQARTAAELAVRVLRGEVPVTTARVQGVPALLLSPVPVTLDNVRRVIVDGGVYTTEEICVEPYTDACAAAGLLDGGAS